MLIGEVSAAVLEVAADMARAGIRIGIIRFNGIHRLAYQKRDGCWVVLTGEEVYARKRPE